MTIPTDAEILVLLDQLDQHIADELESNRLDFKPWQGTKEDKRVAIEYAVCFANAEGGVVVFGVEDKVKGRAQAIQGVKTLDLDDWRRSIYQSTVPSLAVELSELSVPEGTGKLLVMRVGKGTQPPYGTSQGIYKVRVGKNCMPMPPSHFVQVRASTGAVDWSGQPAEGVTRDDLDPVEIARARNLLRARNPESELLDMGDDAFLQGLEAVKAGQVTHTGLLLFGNREVLSRACPQNQLHYVYQLSEDEVPRNDLYREGLLQMLTRMEEVFSGPLNPEQEVSLAFGKLRVPAFSLDVVREAVLNAVTHRDYTDPGEVLIRHTPDRLVITSPGGFVGGITLDNILRHEAVARNRTLANAFIKLRLVESAGTGRGRMFKVTLSYGKHKPEFETDGSRVTLRLFNTGFNKGMAALVARWNREGRRVSMDELLVLSFMQDHPYIDALAASKALQLPMQEASRVLDQLGHPKVGILERKGGPKSPTYHLAKGVAKELLGKAAYTKTKGINPARYTEMVRQYVTDYGAITPKECRELLGLGDSKSAQVEVSRYFKKWAGPDGFLRMEGAPPRNRYLLRGDVS